MVLTSYARRLRASRRPPGGDGTVARVPAGVATDDGQAGDGQGRRARGLVTELRCGPTVGQADVPPVVGAIRLIVLVAVFITIPFFTPGFGHGGRGIAIALTLAVAAFAWAVWNFSGDRPLLWVGMLALMGAAGGVLAGLSSLSSAVAVGFVVAISAGARLSAEVSAAILAETVAAFVIAGIVSDAGIESILGWSAGFIGFWAFGLTRRAYLLRAIEAEEALEQARRAHAAETQAAALAERARIAREIHDVLAHALAAVSVNLQAAEGLLDGVPDKGPELAKVVECVERAGALTKEGMAEARRAILALRDDTGLGHTGLGNTGLGNTGLGNTGGWRAGYAAQGADRGAGTAMDSRTGTAVGAVAPSAERLIARLRALADDHGAAGDAAVEFTVAGTPRPLGADGALTAYRTAQEALTNARKHAPGQPVSLTVSYTTDAVTLQVSNPLPPGGTEGPLAHAGTGYGLTGLRERAALAQGTLSAAREDGRWTVRLRLPA